MPFVQLHRETLTRRSVHSAVLNPTGSKTFLKRIVPTAVSFILHQRVEVEEQDFETRNYGSVRYHQFKRKVRNPVINYVKNCLMGAMDALDKNYLRELYLIFENNKNVGQIEESYRFAFQYMGTDVIPLEQQETTKRDLDDAANFLLTTIASLNSHEPFKMENINIKIAMTYYEEVTPADYNPPHFGKEQEKQVAIRNALAKQPSHFLSLGVLKTGYHKVKCQAKGKVFSTNVSNITIDNTELTTIREVTESEHSKNSTSEIEGIGNNLYTPEDDVEFCDEHFRCTCKISFKVKNIDSLLCSKCCNYQHCACVGYLQKTDVPDKYVCPQCKEDVTITPEKAEKEYNLALLMLTLAFAFFTKQIPQDIMQMMPSGMTYLVFGNLAKLNIIEKEHGIWKLNFEKTEETVRKLFSQKIEKQKRRQETIPESMNLEDEVSQASSVVLGRNASCKKLKDA